MRAELCGGNGDALPRPKNQGFSLNHKQLKAQWDPYQRVALVKAAKRPMLESAKLALTASFC
jgi:hypothetical protein